MIKDDGSVKVLDFGLAKVASASISSSDGDDPELSPTISTQKVNCSRTLRSNGQEVADPPNFER